MERRLSLRRIPKPLVVAAGLTVVLGLGATDILTGPDLSFLVFYFGPVLFVTWFAGAAPGTFIALVSSAVWLVDDVHGLRPGVHPAVPAWNVMSKLAFFLLFVGLVAALREALERERQAEREKVGREMRIAREVQTALLPQVLPRVDGLDCAGGCDPVESVGGDFYDFLMLGDGRLGVVIGDVSGKGIPAALLMANVLGLLRSEAPRYGLEVARLMSEVNSLIHGSIPSQRYVTLFCAAYDPGQREFTYVNAGHNPPLLLRERAGVGERDGCLRLDAGGTVVGLFPDGRWEQGTVRLGEGDVLVLYTDGLSESLGPGEEEFGEGRIVRIVREGMDLPAEAIREQLVGAVRTFASGRPLHDDVTVVIVRGKPAAPSLSIAAASQRNATCSTAAPPPESSNDLAVR